MEPYWVIQFNDEYVPKYFSDAGDKFNIVSEIRHAKRFVTRGSAESHFQKLCDQNPQLKGLKVGFTSHGYH